MMAPIPFSNHQASGQEELGGASPTAMNVVIDATGTVRRRPGIDAYSGAPSTVVDANGLSGLYVLNDGRLFAVASSPAERPIYYVTSGGAVALGGGLPQAGLVGTSRPTFAETELLLVIAGGSEMQQILLSGPTSTRLGGSPPLASHVIANSSRLLANDVFVDRTKVNFSGVFEGDTDYSGSASWPNSPDPTNPPGFFTAAARPDDIAGLFESTNEAMAFGTQTLQIFSPDSVQVYSPTATREIGCSAPYSVIKRDQEFFWLDHLRRFVKSDGRGMDVLSDPIKKTLEGISTIADCFGFRVLTGPVDALVWVFPTDGRAFCLQAGGGWSQWSGWDDATNNWAALAVSCAAMRTDSTFANVVGTTDGKIGQLSLDTNTDLGTRIRAYVESGYLSRGTDKRKHSKLVKLKFKRGTTSSSSAPQAIFGWRDRPGAWAEIPVSLGAAGDTDPVVEFRSLGTYTTREWKLEFSGTDDFVLVSATEEFDVLDI